MMRRLLPILAFLVGPWLASSASAATGVGGGREAPAGPGAEPPRKPVPAYFDWWRTGNRMATGQTMPDVPLYDLDGNEVRLSSYAGRRYFLVVWGSW